jgi:hypothetical protein
VAEVAEVAEVAVGAVGAEKLQDPPIPTQSKKN